MDSSGQLTEFFKVQTLCMQQQCDLFGYEYFVRSVLGDGVRQGVSHTSRKSTAGINFTQTNEIKVIHWPESHLL